MIVKVMKIKIKNIIKNMKKENIQAKKDIQRKVKKVLLIER